MRISCFLTSLLLLSIGSALAQPATELEKHALLDGRVTISLPAKLQLMSDELMLAKYSAARKPTLAYSDEKAAVSVALSEAVW